MDKVKEYVLDISDELYAFSSYIADDERQALGFMLDSVQAQFIENGQLLEDFCQDSTSQFFRRTIKRYFYLSIYKIAESRLREKIDQKSCLFFKHKGQLSIDEIVEVMGISRSQFIECLHLERSRLLGSDYQMETPDLCRRFRSILSQYELGDRDKKWENHLSNCSSCRHSLAQFSAKMSQIDELIPYNNLSGIQKGELASFLDIVITAHLKRDKSSGNEKIQVFFESVFSRKMLWFYLGVIMAIVSLRFLL